MRARRLLTWTLSGIAAAVGAVAAVLTLTLTTEPGTRVALRFLSATFAINVEFDEMRGTLSGPLSLERLSLTSDRFEFEARQLTFDWRLLQLARRRVHVDSLRVVGFRAVLHQNTPDTAEGDTVALAESDTSRFELPVEVVFDLIQLEDGAVAVAEDLSVSDVNVTASGTLDDYQADLLATVSASDIVAQVEVSGRGHSQGFRAERLYAALLEGEVRGDGTFSWQPQIEWQAAFTALGLTPAAVAPNPDDWPGQVSLSAAVAGSLVHGRPEMRAEIDTLYGTLRDLPLTGVASARIAGSEYSLDLVDIDWGTVRLDAEGHVGGERLDLDFSLNVPDLAGILPGASGSVSASGQLDGSPSAPVIKAMARASGVVFDEFRLSQADAMLDVDWRDLGNNDVDVDIDGLEVGTQAIDSVRLTVRGARGAHDVVVSVASREADFQLMASGGLTDWIWNGALKEMGIEARTDWRLDEPATLTASKDRVALDDLCLLASEGNVCVGGTWESEATWRVRSSMTTLPLALLGPLLPETWAIDGTLSGRINASGSDEIPEIIDIDLQPSAGSVQYTHLDTAAVMRHREGHITVSAGGDSVLGNFGMEIAEGDSGDFGSLSAETNFSSLSSLIEALSADGFADSLLGAWAFASSIDRVPLSLLRPTFPEGLRIAGTVSGELSAGGIGRIPEYVELDLRPSAGFVQYAFGDTVAVAQYREAHIAVAGSGDSLRGSIGLQVADRDSAEFGRLSAETSFSSLASVIDALSADGSVDSLQGNWTFTSSIDRLPFSLFRPTMPDELSLEGSISGELNAGGTGRIPEYVELDVRPSAGAVRYAFGDTAAVAKYREAQIAVAALGDSLRGNLTVQVLHGDGGEFGALSAEIELQTLTDLIGEMSREGVVEALQDEWLFNLSMDQIPLPLFNVFLPEDIALAGSLDGAIDLVAAPDGTLRGQLNLQPQTAGAPPSRGTAVRTIRLDKTRVQATVGPEGVRGEATFSLVQPDSAPYATVSGSLAMPGLSRLDQSLESQTLEGRGEASVDIRLLDVLSDELSGSEGRLDAELTAGGTIGEMQLSGQYRLQGQTDLTSLGIALRDIDVTADDTAGGDLRIEGSVTSGGGRLTIQGMSPAIPTRESPARLSVRGRDFQAMRTDEISLVVSPDIELTIGGRELGVDGTVVVPRASIDIVEIPESAVPVSDDVVFVAESVQTEEPPMDVTADVTLELGDNVRFRGFGFTSHLEGTLVASEAPERPTQGRGELVFREGIYRGYGQNLTIEPGRLIFAGPIDDPTVDVRAFRRATDGTQAGFLIGGTLQEPNVEIWSDPPKTDSDALSYVLFGRSMSQSTESDQAQAGSAAAVLGGNMLAMAMASQVGLDEARIETGNRRQDAAFYAGKYISSRVYVAYGIGLFEQINVFRVRYLISRKFTLQAETGTRDSGDILYRIEF